MFDTNYTNYHQFKLHIILCADLDPVSGFEFAFEQTQEKRIEPLFLNGAFERGAPKSVDKTGFSG